jgi:copper(I)-binding protein
MAGKGQDEEVIGRLQQHHAQVLGWSRQHIAVEQWDLRLRPSRTQVRSRGGPKLAASIAFAGLVLVVVTLVATSMVPNQAAGPGGTMSHAPTGPSFPATAAAGSRPLSISGGGDTGCQSEGGCAAFVRIQGVDESPKPELRFEMSATGLTLPADAPHWIVAGRYTVSAHLNWVSDVIVNGQSPQVGGVVGSCTRDVVIEPSVASVAVRITFHGLNPCEIAVETGVGAPSPSTTGSRAGMLITQATATLLTGSTRSLRIYAAITNASGVDDRLLGASSPVAASGGLYAWPACTAAPGGFPCGTRVPMPWWRIQAGETITISGSLALDGVDPSVTTGQSVEVTFRFETSAPVTIQVPVVGP